jgi:hypothetical protein
MDDGEGTVLAWQKSPAIRRGEQSNRLALRCAGTSITASANGETLAPVEGSTYTEGFAWLG